MTGTVMLKRRFLENAGSANFGSQKLHFFEKHYEILKISIGYLSQQTTTTRDKFFYCTGVG